MLPSKLIWFFSFLAYFCHSCTGNKAYEANGYGYHPFHHRNGHFPACGKNVRVTRVTKPVTFGDAPFYDEDCNSLYFVEGNSPAVCRYDIDKRKLYCVKLGTAALNDDNISAVIPIKGMPCKFLITYNDQFCVLTWDGVSKRASFKVISKPVPSRSFPHYILNDVKVAPNGALFFYTVPTFKPPNLRSIPRHSSTLYSIFNRKQRVLISRLDYGNGLGWSPDGKRFYRSDSFLNETSHACYNERTNSLGHPRLLLDYGRLNIPGHPDSHTVDSKGFLWIAAQQGGRRILKVNPYTGEVECAVRLPAKSITSVAFGRCWNGEFECLYATTSRSIFDASPGPITVNDGALFSIQGIGSTGVLPNKVELSSIFKKV